MTPNPYGLPGWIITRKILEAWYPPEEFKLVTIYGPLGYGKSAFAFKIVVELLCVVYHLKVKEAWEMLKQFILFHPEQFFQKLDDISEYVVDGRVPGIVWDDAGLWLYALDWNDPFVKAFGKYLNVARTHLGSIIMTTPSPDMIFKKVRKFPQAYNVNVRKTTGNPANAYDRLAVPYLQYYNIVKGYRVTRVKIKGAVAQDPFNCYLPDDFYAWYKPLRDKYEDIALDLIKKRWKELTERDKTLMSQYYEEMKVPRLTMKLEPTLIV